MKESAAFVANGKGMPKPGMSLMLKAMKITTILLTVFCLQVCAGTMAQVSISGKEVSLERIFTEINEQSGYTVFYDALDLKDARKVNINFRNASVKVILDFALKDQPVVYEIGGKNIFISRKTPTKVNTEIENNSTQNNVPVRVTGKVINQNGDPVPGATVTEKGTKNATSTLGDGTFALSVQSTNAVLVITGANVDEFEYELKGGSMAMIEVTMKISKMDEVQVIAYGTKSKREQLGSVTTIKADEIQKQPVSNPLLSLAGRVPGLEVTQTTGLPGGAVRLRLRGQNNLPSSTSGVPPMDNPLILINGVPLAANNSSINLLSSIGTANNPINKNPYGGLSPLNSINPLEIESIEILRDADATAIYGARGANGVILITTKTGVSGKTKLNVGAYSGVSKVSKTLDMMNTEQYLEMRKKALQNDNLTPTISNAPDLLIFDSTKYTDWKDFFLGNTAKTNDVTASISGGNITTSFLIGAGFHKETYVLPGDFNEKRGSINFSVSHKSLNKKLGIDLSGNFSHIANNSSGNSGALRAFTMIPNNPDLIDSNGDLVWAYNTYAYSDNPLRYLKMPYKALTNNLIGSLLLSYNITEKIAVKSSFGYNEIRVDENSQSPRNSQNPAFNPKGSASFGNNSVKTWIIEPQAEYIDNIGKVRLNVLVGGTIQKNVTASTAISGENYNSDALLGSLVGAGTTRIDAVSNFQYKYSAGFGRLGLNYDRKYYINFTGRRDASSRFGPDNRLGNFGSVAAGWIATEESFIKRNIKSLSFAKLRASYGTTGSDAIANFQFAPYWTPLTRTFQGVAGYIPSNLANNQLSWSINKKLEAAIELGMFKDKLFLYAIWYRNRCGDQLISYNLPSQTGFNGITQNFPALVQNSGWEFQLNFNIIKSSKFTWNSSINVTIPENELLEFPNIEESSYASTYEIGKSLSVLKLYNYVGVDKEDGLYKFSSKNGPTPQPEFSDRITVGDLDPDYYGGFRNEITFKDISVSFLFQFAKQIGQNYLGQVTSASPVGDMFSNVPATYTDSWQKSGDMNKINQRYFTVRNRVARSAASYFAGSTGSYSDASYIRLKNVSISYSLNRYGKLIGLQNANLFLNGQNLFTITGYSGNDPETQGFYNIPPLRTIVLGLQVGL